MFEMWAHDFQNSLVVSEPGGALVFTISEQTFVGFPSYVGNNDAICGGPVGEHRHAIILAYSHKRHINSCAFCGYSEDQLRRDLNLARVARAKDFSKIGIAKS